MDLESRQRRVLPFWLVITRNVSWLAAYIATIDPPSGVITIDALWWNMTRVAIVVGTIITFALEVRHTLTNRVPA